VVFYALYRALDFRQNNWKISKCLPTTRRNNLDALFFEKLTSFTTSKVGINDIKINPVLRAHPIWQGIECN
jgi:hypothetical protein